MTHSTWWLIIDALAVYRLAILITQDTITDFIRHPIEDRGGKLAVLVTCPWCVSIYLAAGAVALTRFSPHAWAYVAAGLAFSAVAGFLAEAV